MSRQALRTEKGLKILSIKVKDIVDEFQETTYKDVANHLIQKDYTHLLKNVLSIPLL